VIRPSNIVLALLSVILFSGCATTKVDLYKYKDVSAIAIVDDSKADYKVEHPTLDANIAVEANSWESFAPSLKDYFLAYNDRHNIFKIDQNGSYRLKLTLHNMGSSKEFTPPRFVERKRKIKTDKGVIIKDESYYTDPYWTYTVEAAAVAELNGPGGSKKFFEAKDASSFKTTGRYPSDVPRARYIESLQETSAKLLKQIANEVAPKGLIVSKKVAIDDNEDFIFMVNMGRSEGLCEGQKLLVYKEIVSKDEIDAKTLNEKAYIGTATVSNQVNDHYAWMMMDDSDQNPYVEVGDVIRPTY